MSIFGNFAPTIQFMTVTIAYGERAKSYYLFSDDNSSFSEYSLVLKATEVDSKYALSAKVIRAPQNFHYTIQTIAKFEVALGFIKYKDCIFLIVANNSKLVSVVNGQKIFKITAIDVHPVCLEHDLEHVIRNELKGLLGYFNSGSFFYGQNFNICLNTQAQTQVSPEIIEEREGTFLWNLHLLKPILELSTQVPPDQKDYLNSGGLFAKISKGFFDSSFVQTSLGEFNIAIYTRLGRKKAGTRYNSRGLDDEGNASIFGETEIIVSSEKFKFSYLLLRGSVPVFWMQQGMQIGFSQVQITRTPIATQPSFDRHFERLIDHYGLVHVLNLLANKEGSVELLLTEAYEYHINNCKHSEQLSLTAYDLNKMIQRSPKSGLDTMFQYLSRDVQIFGYYVNFFGSDSGRTQKGIFRVNCLDCLDRTNMAQDFIARKVVDLFFRNYLIGREFKQIDSIRVQSAVSRLFADNGDAISHIYAGTGALRSSFTRRGQTGIFDYLNDFQKSVVRLYNGHVTDRSKQSAIDYVLGNISEASDVELFNPISQKVQNHLALRKSQYMKLRKLKISALTWNTGGVLAGTFPDYFVDFKDFLADESEIYVICLQEIVQLNATQIVSSDPEKRVQWETVFLELLSDYFGRGKFVQLVSNQLVGTSLTVFVQSHMVDEIKNVEIGSIKTGLGGMAGNKGSIAVRFEIHENAFCFVGSHFTAGQSAALDRLKEYFSVLQDLSFSKGKRILPSNFALWMGDFNFRNDVDGLKAKDLIKKGAFEELLLSDQLNSLRSSAELFASFDELKIEFAPTYKYDPGTNIYDTSEKNRVPSWTDRVLVHGKKFSGVKYNRAEVDVSDHKPVYLQGALEIEICDRPLLQKLEQDLFAKLNIEDSEAPEPPPRPNRK